MRLSTQRLATVAGALIAAATLAFAQIERLSLAQMATKIDDAVDGKIIERRVFRVDHPKDGPELYFTTLTIQGVSAIDGSPLTVDVTFPGGFVDDTHGVSNSEAPSADDIKLRNHVLVFYKWTANMGGDVAANQIITSHGGLYRIVDSKNGTVVQGRGDGYAVAQNVRVSDLRQQLSLLKKK